MSNWALTTFFKRSATAKLILQKLVTRPKTPSELAKELNLHQQSVSKTLLKLAEFKLVTCINPNEPNYRHYTITPQGSSLLKKLK